MDELEMLKEIDKMIDETQDLDRELEESGISRETLTAQAEELKSEYNALSSKLELNLADPLPLRWEKLLRLHSKGDPDAVRLLNMYISDCSFFGSEADECISQYTATRKRLDELTCWETWYSSQSQQYARLFNRIKCCKVGHAESGTDAETVFNLMMRNGCTSGNADPAILLDNLTEISSFIHSAGLENASPLIWFLVIIHNQKKLCSTPGFIVNPQNILRYQEYNISQNNGKNYDRYEQYCDLYLDLKDMFPQADMELCDMGFLKCSNLAQWCCDFVEYPCGIPSTAAGIIERFSPDFFSDPWNEIELLRSSNITYDELERWEFAHSRLTGLIQSAVQSIRPDDIHELLRNSREFIHGLAENSGILSEIRSEDVYMTLISLCVKAVARFEVLFAEHTACAIVL
ncbi:MAG: hypothetical protein ACI4Q4_04445 [Oscillospiraceae bacterium]